MLESFVHWAVGTASATWLSRHRDPDGDGIVVLPVPSELVMGGGARRLSRGQGEMNIAIANRLRVLGSVPGSARITASRYAGRAVIRRAGDICVVRRRWTARAFFDRHGEISTLLAGFCGGAAPDLHPGGHRANVLAALRAVHGARAFLWCTVLATIGYVLGQHEDVLSNVDVQQYVSRALVYLIPALIVTVIVYAWWQRRRGGAKTP